MARDFIKVDRTQSAATQATLLLSYVTTLRSAYELGVKCKAVMDHNNDGAVWTDIELLFGLPTGKGQIVYDLINGSVGSMTGAFQVPDAKNLTETVGG
jgi:hypothetical protein